MKTAPHRLPAPHRLIPSFLIMALGLALSACAAPPRDPLNDYAWERLERLPKDAAEVAAAVAASSREAFLESTKLRVSDVLKDPESARFRKLRLVAYKGGLLACGEVNAKNSYGGYVGFSQFMAGNNYVILLGESNARAGLSGVDMSLVSTVCGNQ